MRWDTIEHRAAVSASTRSIRLGLSVWLGWLDYVLLPALALFLGVTAYGLWRRQRAAARRGSVPAPKNEGP